VTVRFFHSEGEDQTDLRVKMRRLFPVSQNNTYYSKPQVQWHEILHVYCSEMKRRRKSSRELAWLPSFAIPNIQIPLRKGILFIHTVLSTVTRPRAGRSGARFLARSIDFSLLQHVQIGSGSKPAPLTTSPMGSFPGSKTVNHAPPSNADGKNEQSYSYVPFVRLQSLQ